MTKIQVPFETAEETGVFLELEIPEKNLASSFIPKEAPGLPNLTATATETSIVSETPVATETATPTATETTAGARLPSHSLGVMADLFLLQVNMALARLSALPEVAQRYQQLGNIPVMASQTTSVTTTINYTYDPLNRLTAADYSDGLSFSYTYDAAGNRLTETTSDGAAPTTNTYYYDAADRLSSVNGTAYSWDNNGNLLSDGVYTYIYDIANRLQSAANGTDTYSYAYSGLGDRYQQNINNQTTTYTLDIVAKHPRTSEGAAPLTQVLADGTTTYLYGLERIAQQTSTSAEFFLPDALGSVRQLASSTGEIVASASYAPYGAVMSAAGTASSAYGFTEESTDSTIKLVHLRARDYSPEIGRFISKDVWQGDYTRPQSLNQWNYVENDCFIFGKTLLSPHNFPSSL